MALLPRRKHTGINVVGYLNHVLGLGESARQFVRCLETAGVPHATAAIDLGPAVPEVNQPAARWLGNAELPFDLTVLWANPDRYGIDVTPDELPGRRLVGRWAWELESLPDSWASAAGRFLEIWTPSRFVAAAVRAAVEVPVRIIPVPLEVRPAAPLDRGRWNLPLRDFFFLYMFDYHSSSGRKNPLGVITAFASAFPDGDGATLLLKSINAANLPDAATEVEAAAAAHPGVQVIDEAVTDQERRSLLAGCDCYVSLHRSEGFGMTVAEAMAYARPVIATGYGGCTDFLSSRTGYLVPWKPVVVGPNPIYPADALWAEPALERAAQLMREVVEAPNAARARGRRAAASIARDHAPQRVGRQLARALRRAAVSGPLLSTWRAGSAPYFSGWHAAEDDSVGSFAWTGPGERASVRLESPAARELGVRVVVRHTVTKHQLENLAIDADGRPVLTDRSTARSGETALTAWLGRSGRRGTVVEIGLTVGTVRPCDHVPDSDDERSLGVAISEIELVSR